MCFYDTEPYECFVRKTPKARKPHQCDECGDTIQSGTVYQRTTGIFDGHPFTHVQCQNCTELRERIIAVEEAAGCRGIEADPGDGRVREAAREMGLLDSA